MKIIEDTLKNPKTGNWSRKSLTAFTSFILAIVYEFILPFWGMNTKEYVFITLVTLTATVLGLTVWDKKKDDNSI